MEPDSKKMTPPAQNLKKAIDEILVAAKSRPKAVAFHRQELQDTLKGMTTADMLELDPPGADAGIWTNDTAFCKRLGARLFGVSPESVDELPWTHLIYFQQIVTANFIKCLAEAAP